MSEYASGAEIGEDPQNGGGVPPGTHTAIFGGIGACPGKGNGKAGYGIGGIYLVVSHQKGKSNEIGCGNGGIHLTVQTDDVQGITYSSISGVLGTARDLCP